MRSLGRLSKTDLVYAGLTVMVVVLLAFFTFLGYSLAAVLLPVAVGGAAGYCLARLATAAQIPGWAQAAAVVSAAVALIWACLSLLMPFAEPRPVTSLPDLDLSGSGTALGRLAFGFGFVYFSEVFRRVSFPTLFPTTAEEADRQSLERARGVLIVGGILLVLIILGAALFGFLALVAYLVAILSG